MGRRVDQFIDRWLSRSADASQAYHQDAQYHWQITYLRRTLTAMDLVMQDEGIAEQVRDRILRTLVLGAPDEAAALARVEEMKRLAESTRLAPPEAWGALP
jgi:hypothetical protein